MLVYKNFKRIIRKRSGQIWLVCVPLFQFLQVEWTITLLLERRQERSMECAVCWCCGFSFIGSDARRWTVSLDAGAVSGDVSRAVPLQSLVPCSSTFEALLLLRWRGLVFLFLGTADVWLLCAPWNAGCRLLQVCFKICGSWWEGGGV